MAVEIETIKDSVLGGLQKLEKRLMGRFTESLCPECVHEEKFDRMKIAAVIYQDNGRVLIEKECPEHGITKDVYYGNSSMYERVMKYRDPGIRFENPDITKSEINCPADCGMCADHKSHTALGNIAVTNRCDLHCWYCFYYAKEGSSIYEPTLEQIRRMLRNMKEKRPVGANAVQLTGGEPSLREDIIDIVKIAKEEGYKHVQFNTNGIRLSRDSKFAKKLKDAGVKTVYMSFDGVDSKTNPKNYWEVPKVIENCRKVDLGIVLVPTVIGGCNDHQIGDIVRFAAKNNDIVRSVNFQPVSLVGRMPKKERERKRITVADVCKKLEEQTSGQIRMDDFYPVPVTARITELIEALRDRPEYRLSIHPVCGAATYVYVDGDELVPITRFVRVNELLDEMGGLGRRIKRVKGMSERVLGSKLKGYIGDHISNSFLGNKVSLKHRIISNLKDYIIREKVPEGFDIDDFLENLIMGDYKALGRVHKEFLFIGIMHFMDPYNYDVERVERCDIHYATPDGRIIPFCAFNVLPELYRDRIQREYSIPAEEWEREHGRKLSEDKYKRNITEKEKIKVSKFYRDSIGEIAT